MKNFFVIFLVFIFTLVGFNSFITPSVSAAVDPNCYKSSILLLPPWYAYLEVGPKLDKNGTEILKDKDGKVVDPCAIIGPKDKVNGEFSFSLALPRIALAIIEILLRIAGMVAVGFVIYGGFRYITSQGEPEALKKAQSTILNAIIGMVICILAVTIVAFAGNTLWGG